jgi:hypothetical protein
MARFWIGVVEPNRLARHLFLCSSPHGVCNSILGGHWLEKSSGWQHELCIWEWDKFWIAIHTFSSPRPRVWSRYSKYRTQAKFGDQLGKEKVSLHLFYSPSCQWSWVLMRKSLNRFIGARIMRRLSRSRVSSKLNSRPGQEKRKFYSPNNEAVVLHFYYFSSLMNDGRRDE